MTGKKGLKKTLKKPPFKLNVKGILEKRKTIAGSSKKRAKILVITISDDDDNNEDKSSLVSPKSDFVFDPSKYNIPFSENAYTNTAESCLQRLLIMSIEQNELKANIHYNHLMNAKWSPELNDVRSIFQKWKIDLDSVICKPPQKHEINISELQFGRHNFELVMDFIIKSILRNNQFSNDDLLTLAKFAITIYLDHGGSFKYYLVKLLFSLCIETALHGNNESEIIIHAQEFYSKHEAHLLKMTRDLFFPCEGHVMRKIYAYLTFKLYKSLTGNIDCIIEMPSTNDWFIQDVVDINYFRQNSPKLLKSIIKLLEHVVITFDLYSNEEKMREMDAFLGSLVAPIGATQKLCFITRLWRSNLFRIHVERCNSTLMCQE